MEIRIVEELKNKIEALQYEVEARKDLITYMVSNGIDCNSSTFQKYEKEYRDYFVAYNKAKQEMIDTYLNGMNYKSWTLDFHTAILHVEVE